MRLVLLDVVLDVARHVSLNEKRDHIGDVTVLGRHMLRLTYILIET